MRIKLFETFEEPNFREISTDEYNEKIDSRALENWTSKEIDRLTESVQKIIGTKIEIRNHEWVAYAYILSKEHKLSDVTDTFTVYVIKQEDEWFLITIHPLSLATRRRLQLGHAFECDQFSGLEACIKQLFKK
jgi:hypothetical protein